MKYNGLILNLKLPETQHRHRYDSVKVQGCGKEVRPKSSRTAALSTSCFSDWTQQLPLGSRQTAFHSWGGRGRGLFPVGRTHWGPGVFSSLCSTSTCQSIFSQNLGFSKRNRKPSQVPGACCHMTYRARDHGKSHHFLIAHSLPATQTLLTNPFPAAVSTADSQPSSAPE